MELSSRISTLRESLGLNQVEFALKIGSSDSTISNWETGKTTPSRGTLRRIAEICGVSFAWLRDGEGEMLVGNPPSRIQATDETTTHQSSKPRMDAAGVGGYNAGSVRTITIDPSEDMTYDPSWVVPILLSAYHAVMHRDDLERARELKEQGKRFRVRLVVEQDDPKTTEPPPTNR